MASVNGSYVSPIADATIFPKVFEPTGLVASMLQGVSVWKAILTLFLGAVVYDQRMFFFVLYACVAFISHHC